MQKWIVKSSLICIFLSAGFLTKGQDTADVFQEGDSLFQAGAYRAAEIAYERVAYRSPRQSVNTRALYQKSKCLMARQQYGKIPSTLERLPLRSLPDSMVFKIRYQMALSQYLGQRFEEASNQLKRIYFYIEDTSVIKKAFYLHALVYNELAEWDQAKQKLLLLIDCTQMRQTLKDSLRGKVQQHYSQDNYPNLRDPKTAKILSAILPGLGQIYTGYWGDGVVNVSLQLLSLAFGAYAVYHEYYITGIIIGGTLFRSFYMGGIRHVQHLAKKKNHQLKRTYNDSLKTVIIKLEKKRRGNP